MQQNVLNHKAQLPETPVEKVFRVFGAARATAIAGLTTEALRKWNRPLRTGGGGGLVPARYQARYLAAAELEARDLTAADFIAEPR